jgi:hypothetical protein
LAWSCVADAPHDYTKAIFAPRPEKVKVRVAAPDILYRGVNLMCARSYLLCTYLRDDFGNGIGAMKWGTSANSAK